MSPTPTTRCSARSCSRRTSGRSRRALVAGLAVVGLASGCTGTCDDPGVVCTVAGVPGAQGFNGDGFDALDTWLYYPTALAWAADGRLLVDDFNNMRIRALGDDGRLETVIGNGVHAYAVPGDALATPLENPIDLDVLPDGRVVIAELHAGRILVAEIGGDLDVLAGTGDIGFTGDGGPALEADLSEAAGLGVSADGSVFVADTDNHCVRRIDADGARIDRVAGGAGSGLADGDVPMFRGPQRVLATEDALFVADTYNHAVRRIDTATGVTTTIAGDGQPGHEGDGGLAVDARLAEPHGLALAPDGSLLIADAANARVRRVRPDGTIETILGTGEVGEARDRVDALEATLQFPADVLVGDDGDLYVADMQNGVVRRVAGLLAD